MIAEDPGANPRPSRLAHIVSSLVWLTAWLLTGVGVDRLVCKTPESPALLQTAMCVVFGLLTCHLLLQLAPFVGLRTSRRRSLRDTWEYLVPVAAYSLIWGRQHFLNFLYHDEFSRFLLTRLSPWDLGPFLFQPVANGHVMPIAQMYWYVMYSVFHANYIGVAAGSFVFSVTSITGAHALIRAVSPPRWRLVSLVPATIVAATPHSPLVTLWKGAGDSLVLTLAFLLPALALLAQIVLGRRSLNRPVFVLISAGLIASVFSSSLVTLVPVYMLPFGLWLAVAHGELRRTAGHLVPLFAIAVAASVAYWCVRRFTTGLQVPPGSWTWPAVFGSLRGVLEVYLPSVVLRCAFVIGSLGTFAWLLMAMHDAARPPRRRTKIEIEPAVMLWVLGVEMFLVGTLQLVWARGMVYEARWTLSGYHLFLPSWGLALACASLLVVVGTRMARFSESGLSRRARNLASVLLAGGLCGYCAYQSIRVERSWPLLTAYPLEHACAPEPLPPTRTRITVIHARTELEEDLRHFLDSALVDAARQGTVHRTLPDLALVDSPLFPEFAMWPSRLNAIPSSSARLRQMSQLRFQLHVFGLFGRIPPASPIRLVPPEEVNRVAWTALYQDPAIGAFLRKYWPQFEPETPR